MKILQTNELNHTQKMQIHTLQECVNAHDGLRSEAFLSAEINFDRTLTCFYLGYEGDTLTAFLTLFLPTAEEAEVTAFTHPQQRGQGRFQALLAAARVEMQKAGVPQFLFALDSACQSGNAALTHFAHTYQHTEYRMERDTLPAAAAESTVKFKRVGAENHADYRTVIAEVFPDIADNAAFLEAVLTHKSRKGYVGYCAGEPAAAFGLLDEGSQTFLYCVGVREAFRGQGIGKALVRFALPIALAQSPRAVLDVDSDNPRAKHVYEACGFRTVYATDYYTHPV